MRQFSRQSASEGGSNPDLALNLPVIRVPKSSSKRKNSLIANVFQQPAKVLPWVHTLIANIKGNIRGVHHGVSPKHLPRYLAEFCLEKFLRPLQGRPDIPSL
jgi:hypothetical protein